ncbi:BTAD domain-containing putative transcriptional regulator [Actinoplanes siamensis]|uniref:BTAD domain-containing putative transcriptional regulator n=1 Tax=Actinoplanes siamensis TaxID=1223317 RepID=UPI001942F7D1|nr:BTAD domain-containing putative transcriptional regulator [Actinoplanes siamensis]
MEADTRPGDLIRAFRRRAALTQDELARRSGLSTRTLRDLESNRVTAPRKRSLRALAGALLLSPGEADRLLREDPGTVGPLRVELLGPLSVTLGGRQVPLGAPAHCTVLATLALHAGRTVAREELIAALWGDRPPRTSASLVRAVIARLRRLLDIGGDHHPLHTDGDGYALRLGPDDIDAVRFEDLLARSEAADPGTPTAAAIAREALRCWRGPVVADGAERVRDSAAARTLARGRVTAAVRCARLDVDGSGLDPVREVAAAEPLDEPLHAELMLALARCGDLAGARRVYGEIAARLARSGGRAPGERLLGAYREIGTERPRVRPWVGPAQLPRAPESFVGRAGLLRALDDGPGVCVVGGGPGTGKTAAVLHWAHRARPGFPDGQLFADLGGDTRPELLLGEFLHALGVPPERIPASLDGRTGLFRSVVADRRVLIVLDNARSPEQVLPLLPGAPGCRTVVTSRDQLRGLIVTASAASLTVGPLDAATSRELLARRLAAEPAAVAGLAAPCAGLPLALSVVAAEVALTPHTSLADLAARLRGSPSPPDEVRRVFADAYRGLGAEAARQLRAYAHGSPAPIGRDALDELVRSHLLTALPAGGHTIHPLLREWLRGLPAGPGDEPLDRGRALLAEARGEEEAGRHEDALRGRQAALVLFQQAGDRQGQARALTAVGWSWVRLGRPVAALTHCRRALDITVALDDLSGRAAAHGAMGVAHHRLGDHAEAVRWLRRAQELHHLDGDTYGEACARAHLGDAYDASGQHVTAVAQWQAAAGAFDRLGDPRAATIRSKAGLHPR